MLINKCAIALGSNLGDSISIIQQSLTRLAQTPGITLESHSSFYQTAPVGPPQPDYINACALVDVSITPLELLATTLKIEQEFGRVRLEPNGPRTLDLDILLFGDLILNLPELQIPHPRMCQRAFVLVPLSEIAPLMREPRSQKLIADLLQGLDCGGVTKILPKFHGIAKNS